MGIYLISIHINFLFLCDNITANFSFSSITSLIESIIILFVSCILSMLLRKNKIAKKYLLGE